MKLFKKLPTVTKHIYTAEFGWVESVISSMYILGIKFSWKENHPMPIDKQEESLEHKLKSNDEAVRHVSYSEMAANMPMLSNEAFDKFQQSIYPTRF